MKDIEYIRSSQRLHAIDFGSSHDVDHIHNVRRIESGDERIFRKGQVVFFRCEDAWRKIAFIDDIVVQGQIDFATANEMTIDEIVSSSRSDREVTGSVIFMLLIAVAFTLVPDKSDFGLMAYLFFTISLLAGSFGLYRVLWMRYISAEKLVHYLARKITLHTICYNDSDER